MKTLKLTTSFFVAFLFASNLFAQPVTQLNAAVAARDKITWTWHKHQNLQKGFFFRATKNEPFTVNWGDGYIETVICNSDVTSVVLNHPYEKTGEYMVTIEASNNNCKFISLYIESNILVDIDIKECTALTRLILSSNALTDIDLTECTALTELGLSHNQFAKLDISNCTNLINFTCSSNKLTNLDLSNCQKLEILQCVNNELTNLDLSNCQKLEQLQCDNNILIDLDLSNCLELKYLLCRHNELTNLDLSNCPEFLYLLCDHNELINLDLSNCMNLTDIDCSYNELTNLDLSHYPNLLSVSCSDNKLTNLDLSHCPNLLSVSCSDNKLTNLDLSHCPNLLSVSCSDNKLSNLDLSNNTKLTSLKCYNNELTKINLSGCTVLKYFNCDSNQLQLSDLYEIQLMGIRDLNFGTQNLLPQTAIIGEELFSEQSVFAGIFTNYYITKESVPASKSDYTVVDGKLTFNAPGEYIVTMTNAAIDSSAKIIVPIEILPVKINENAGANIKVYPNPTTGELRITNRSHVSGKLSEANYELQVENIEIFDVFGRIMPLTANRSPQTVIDISHLPEGVYFLNIDGETFKIIKTNK